MRYPLLALLSRAPAHGYELKQEFEDHFGAARAAVNIGQVYSTLQRLERDGLVASKQVDQAARPAKRVYTISEQGRRVLDKWLAEATRGPVLRDEFFMKLMLARATGAAEPLELIERQRSAYLQALRDLQEGARAEQGNLSTQLLIEGASLHLEADLKWLDVCEGATRRDGGARRRRRKMTAIIEARGLERTYEEAGAAVRALAGVDLAVERGEFVAVMGPSGSGKSTLLHLLGGLDRPSGGELWLDGERVDGLSEGAWAKRRRRQVGYLFQFFNLISNLSASGNAELPALLAGVPAGEGTRAL